MIIKSMKLCYYNKIKINNEHNIIFFIENIKINEYKKNNRIIKYIKFMRRKNDF